METSPILTDVALTFNLTQSTADQADAGAQFLIPLLQRLELPSTWILDEPAQAKMLAALKLAHGDFELALTVGARTPQRLRSELASLQAEVTSTFGRHSSVVAGDGQQLRSRAGVLAEMGIGAVVSTFSTSESDKPARPLPCGLWQLDPTCNIPQPRSRWSILPARQPNAKKLCTAGVAGAPQIIAVDLANLGRRDLHGCASLVGEVAEACQRQELRVAKISELAAELTKRNEVKPQRSILRRAA